MQLNTDTVILSISILTLDDIHFTLRFSGKLWGGDGQQRTGRRHALGVSHSSLTSYYNNFTLFNLRSWSYTVMNSRFFQGSSPRWWTKRWYSSYGCYCYKPRKCETFLRYDIWLYAALLCTNLHLLICGKHETQ